jgi:hypothetical protein
MDSVKIFQEIKHTGEEIKPHCTAIETVQKYGVFINNMEERVGDTV